MENCILVCVLNSQSLDIVLKIKKEFLIKNLRSYFLKLLNMLKLKISIKHLFRLIVFVIAFNK